MDAPPNIDSTFFEKLYNLYKYKYRQRDFDMIVAADDQAFQFVLKFREKLFRDAPVVFCGVSSMGDAEIADKPQFAGVMETIAVKSTLKTALRLHTDARAVAIIRDVNGSKIANDAELRSIVKEEREDVHPAFFESADEEGVERLFRKTEYNGFVLLLTVDRDELTSALSQDEALEVISLTEDVPVYSCWEFLLGQGVVGGKVTSGFRHGELVAEIAIRIMTGTKPADVGIVRESAGEYIFDYQRLKQFGVSLSSLPEESSLIHAPSSFYEVNRGTIWIVSSLIGGMLLVIGILVFHMLYRRKAEQGLQKTRASLEALLNATTDMAFLVDASGECLAINRPTARHLGRRPDEIIGNRVYEFMSPEIAQERKKHFDTVRADGESMRFVEEENDRCYDITVYPVLAHEDEGDVQALGVFARDITEHRKAEEALKEHAEALERANEELQQFAYVASHDLQEPLRTISSHVQLIQRRFKGQLDARADKSIQFAVDGAKRMQGLINDLLQYSRVGTRAKPLMPTDCEEILQTALDNLQVTIQEAGATVSHDELPVVIADQSQILQVFQNFIENGMKFRGDNPPRIHIRAEQREDDLLFSVSDNGIGIDTQFADRIFAIFQRLHGVGKYPGSGIGLAICKKIIERHGGEIWVESEPGKGATFFFTIPNSGECNGDRQEGTTD
jgi:PAS domain S-box-containing protein